MQDYKRMTSELIAKNITYVLTGFTALILIGILSSMYLGVNFGTLFVGDDKNVLDIVLVDDSVNYLTPSVTNKKEKVLLELAGEVTEDGQITAIHTTQVTYKENKYIVQLGDTLRIIAAQVYGDPEAYAPIMKANNLTSPDLIEVGMELVIPR